MKNDHNSIFFLVIFLGHTVEIMHMSKFKLKTIENNFINYTSMAGMDAGAML